MDHPPEHDQALRGERSEEADLQRVQPNLFPALPQGCGKEPGKQACFLRVGSFQAGPVRPAEKRGPGQVESFGEAGIEPRVDGAPRTAEVASLEDIPGTLVEDDTDFPLGTVFRFLQPE